MANIVIKSNLKKNKLRILITGGHGFIGRNLVKKMQNENYKIFIPKHKDFDLTRENKAKQLFNDIKPDYVINLAGKVGGNLDNLKYPVEYFYENILINLNTYKYSNKFNVKKLISLVSGCSYPNELNLLQENKIWNGYPPIQSSPYGMSKKMNLIQSFAYFKQHNLNTINLIPSNVYGEFDNFDLEQSHVVPAIIRKFFEAIKHKKDIINIWGNSENMRDFIYVEDLVNVIILVLKRNFFSELPINIATGKSVKIKKIISLLKKITKYNGKIKYDINKPSGRLISKYSISYQKKIIPEFYCKTSIEKGLEKTYKWYSNNQT